MNNEIQSKCLAERMENDGSSIKFFYNNKNCGVEFYGDSPNFTFCLWCGDFWRDYDNISFEDVVKIPFYDGRSLTELSSEIDIFFY